VRRFSLLTALLLAVFLAPLKAEAPAPTLIQQAFDRMYDLDFAGAHRDLDGWQKLHPEDPLAPASHAAAFLYSEFARLGILESELFVDDTVFEARKKPTPDPQLKKLFESALSQSEDLAGRILAKNPSDTNAQFARVLAVGLRADYAALIEKRDLAAIRYTKQGRVLAEQLLKQKPDAYDAHLAVGIENYLSGIKPAPVRWILQMGGVRTDKQQGLRDLELTAAHPGLMAPFARLLLAVAALRDKDNAKACSLLNGLARQYPQNPLYRRELNRSHC